jgi:uncharacterized protein
MKTAVNFSAQAAALLRSGEVRFDLFKSHTEPKWLEMALMSHPAYVHLPLHADEPDLSAAPWAMFDEMVAQTQTRWINIHLSARRDRFREGSRQEVKDRWLESLGWLAARHGRQRVIAENTVHRPGDDQWVSWATDPAFITEVVEEAGVGLLLDSAHARVSAVAHGRDVFEDLRGYPLHRLVDWHLSGTAFHEGRWRDSMAMTEEDWQIADWLVSLMMVGKAKEPENATLEYGGLGPVFEWRSSPAELTLSLNRLEKTAKGLSSLT